MKLFKSLAVSAVALLFAATAQAKEVTLLMDWFPQGNQSVFWQAMLDNDEHDLKINVKAGGPGINTCLLYTSPSPRDQRGSRMPSSA